MARSNQRKQMIATIRDVVKRWKGERFTEKEQQFLVKQLLNVIDSEVEGIFESDPAKKIPAIIGLTYEYQLDTKTSEDLSNQAEQLRSLAYQAAKHLIGDQAAALEAGINLGMALKKFLFESGPFAEIIRVHMASRDHSAGGRDKGHKTKQLRIAWLKNAAREKFRNKPNVKPRDVARYIQWDIEQIQNEAIELEDASTNDAIMKWKISLDSIYKQVLKAEENL
jgi:hypothetical protein